MEQATLNENFYKLIREVEGCRLTAYKCPAGKWTIGYGHTDGVVAGMSISQRQADELLNDDAAWCLVDVLRVLPDVRGDQLAALASFVYNVGWKNWRNSSLLKELQKRRPDIKQVHNQWRRWIYAGGKPLNGLRNRREKELKLFFGSKYLKPQKQTL